ncbi:proteasome-associated protein ECM29 [Tanacetum coccineum]
MVLKAFKNPDFFGVVLPLLFEMCNVACNSIAKQESSPNDADKAEAHETDDSSVPHDKIIINCVTSCVQLARTSDILKWQKDLGHVYSNSVSPGITWIVKVSVFTSIKELCSKINDGLKDSDQSAQHADLSLLVIELFNSLSPKVIDCISIVKIAQAEIDQLKLMGPVILGGVLKSLDGYTGSESDTIARETKTFAFQAIGLLAKRLPQLFRDKTDMAVRLFNALKLESPSIRLIVQEATNSLAVAYKDAPKTVLNDLESLLLENSQVEQGEVRFCALRWATTLFDSQHCPSRFICMLGTADTKLDIREMALEGLFLGKDQGRYTSDNINFKHPKLTDMLDYIVRQQPQLLESSELREERLLFPSQTYAAAIRFLLQCFEADVEQNIAAETTPEFLASLGNMCLLLEHAMAHEGSVELHATASKALIKIGSHFSEMLASRYAVKVPWIKQLLAHVDLATRECAAWLLGIASSGVSISAASDLILELISSIKL